jgi:hypothetical protein
MQSSCRRRGDGISTKSSSIIPIPKAKRDKENNSRETGQEDKVHADFFDLVEGRIAPNRENRHHSDRRDYWPPFLPSRLPSHKKALHQFEVRRLGALLNLDFTVSISWLNWWIRIVIAAASIFPKSEKRAHPLLH